jgi:DNA-binding CsgD family transcriptional regulator
VAGIRDHERIRGDVHRLVHRGVGVPQLARETARIVHRSVPFDGTCLLTMDPATLLPTGEFVENGLPTSATVRLTEIELREPDVNKFTALARGPRPAASLGETTEGELDRSTRHRELRRPGGFDDELRLVLTGASGTWGALTLLREARRPRFTPAETRLMASLAGPLADGVRRAVLLGAVATDDDTATGLLVLAPDQSVETTNRAADRWLDELGAGGHAGEHLPAVIRSVAVRARDLAEGADAGGRGARARVRTPAGRWATVQGSLLGDGPDARVAVLVETGRAPELAPLIADAYGLTDRERRITELVAQGFPTSEIGAGLHLSAYTVQDHLKSIFNKTGTGTRGELVARLFFDHYAPRLADRSS